VQEHGECKQACIALVRAQVQDREHATHPGSALVLARRRAAVELDKRLVVLRGESTLTALTTGVRAATTMRRVFDLVLHPACTASDSVR
jgi:hypothetical protein